MKRRGSRERTAKWKEYLQKKLGRNHEHILQDGVGLRTDVYSFQPNVINLTAQYWRQVVLH